MDELQGWNDKWISSNEWWYMNFIKYGWKLDFHGWKFWHSQHLIFMCEAVSVHMNLLRKKKQNVRMNICDDFLMHMRVYKSQKK